MLIWVVYESKLGNTAALAQAIARALAREHRVRLVPVEDAGAPQGVDLLIVGCPNHRHHHPDGILAWLFKLPPRHCMEFGWVYLKFAINGIIFGRAKVRQPWSGAVCRPWGENGSCGRSVFICSTRAVCCRKLKWSAGKHGRSFWQGKLRSGRPKPLSYPPVIMHGADPPATGEGGGRDS